MSLHINSDHMLVSQLHRGKDSKLNRKIELGHDSLESDERPHSLQVMSFHFMKSVNLIQIWEKENFIYENEWTPPTKKTMLKDTVLKHFTLPVYSFTSWSKAAKLFNNFHSNYQSLIQCLQVPADGLWFLLDLVFAELKHIHLCQVAAKCHRCMRHELNPKIHLNTDRYDR